MDSKLNDRSTRSRGQGRATRRFALTPGLTPLFLLMDVVGSLLLGLGAVTWVQASTLFSLEPAQARAVGTVLCLLGTLLMVPFLLAVIRAAARRRRGTGGRNAGA